MNGIVVTTGEYRGVFFGYVADDADLTQQTMRLERCRMCVAWPTEQHGVVVLASDGPADGSRISPPAPAITLHGISAVMECTDDAIQRWEMGIWDR